MLRFALYSIITLLVASNLFLLSLMEGHPFSHKDVALAYFNGCIIANKPVIGIAQAKCYFLSKEFEKNLLDISNQGVE